MTCEEACREIIRARYGLQGIYEDYPEDTPERWKAEKEYWYSVVNHNLKIAHQALKDLENKKE